MQFSTDPKLVRPPKLSEQVAQFLSDEIAKGSFKTGENLPSEAELASRFQVSRTIIREALARLEFEGIVESRRGSKARIAPPDQKRVFRIERVEQMDPYELGQLYEFRAILEGAAAALAAKRCSKKDLSKIEDCLKVLFETAEKGQPNLDANVEFHQLVSAASHNDYLINFMQFLNAKIWEQIRGDQETRDPVIDKEAILETHNEHQSIYNAIAEGDEKKAGAAVIQHISNAAKRRNIALDL